METGPRPACPDCGRKFRPLPLYSSATSVATRKCERCGSRWRIVCAPIPGMSNRDQQVHIVSLTRVE